MLTVVTYPPRRILYINFGGTVSLRLRKSIKLMPGVRINISKSGVSTSIGIPGTGLSYTTRLSSGDKSHEQAALQAPAHEGFSAREIRFAVLLYLVLLGCAFATDSWMFAAFITVCAVAIFLVRRQPKAKQDIAAVIEAGPDCSRS
jgi:hypothetical protein